MQKCTEHKNRVEYTEQFIMQNKRQIMPKQFQARTSIQRHKIGVIKFDVKL